MENLPNWVNITLAITGALGSLVTAVATFFLWRVTKILAVETKRMAEVSSQPHVVATITLNKWSMLHFDLHVDNAGNAPAYEIEISFDPALKKDGSDGDSQIPFQNISVLKPGQGVSSYINECKELLGKSFTVSISWKNHPNSERVETSSYTLNMKDYEGLVELGGDPIVKMANNIEKIQNNLSHVFKGNRHLKIDTFNSNDRERQHRVIKERMDQRKAQRESQNLDKDG